MSDKWNVIISTAHDSKMIHVDTEAQARKIYKDVSEALNDYHNQFIDIDNTLINVHCVETVRIDPPIEMQLRDEAPIAIPVYDQIKKIEMPGSTFDSNHPDLSRCSSTYSPNHPDLNRYTSTVAKYPSTPTHEISHTERELFESMMEIDGPITEEKLVRRKKK